MLRCRSLHALVQRAYWSFDATVYTHFASSRMLAEAKIGAEDGKIGGMNFGRHGLGGHWPTSHRFGRRYWDRGDGMSSCSD